MSGLFQEEYFDKNPKTSYTYADTGSYSIHDSDQPVPNMSRHRLHSNEEHILRLSSGLTPMNARRLRSGKIVPIDVDFSKKEIDAVSENGLANLQAVPLTKTSTVASHHPKPSSPVNSTTARANFIHHLYKSTTVQRVLHFCSRSIVNIFHVVTFFQFIRKRSQATKTYQLTSSDAPHVSDSGLEDEDLIVPVNSRLNTCPISPTLTNEFDPSRLQPLTSSTVRNEGVWSWRLLWPFIPITSDTASLASTRSFSVRERMVTSRCYQCLHSFIHRQSNSFNTSSLCRKYCRYPLPLILLFVLLVLLSSAALYNNALQDKSSIKEHVHVVHRWATDTIHTLYNRSVIADMGLLPTISTMYHYVIVSPGSYLSHQVTALWHHLRVHYSPASSSCSDKQDVAMRSVKALQLSLATLENRVSANEKRIQSLHETDEEVAREMEELKSLHKALDNRLVELQRRVTAGFLLQKPRWMEMNDQLHLLMQKWNNVDKGLLQLRDEMKTMSAKQDQGNAQSSEDAMRVWKEEMKEVIANMNQWGKNLQSLRQDVREEHKLLELKMAGYEKLLSEFQELSSSSSKTPEGSTLHAELYGLHQRLDAVEASKRKLEEAFSQFYDMKKVVEKLESSVATRSDYPQSITIQNGSFTLDDLIKNALLHYAQDPVNKPDYALESSGGSVLGTRCTKTYSGRPGVFSFFGIPLMNFYRSPRTVIQPSVHPGECWAFEKDHGQLVIQLSMEIYVSSVTLEHIPRSLSFYNRIDSAPKDFMIKGLESETDKEGITLGNFTYDDSGPSVQTFATQEVGKSFRFVLFEVFNNHGNQEYTCVYRLRVHGTPL